MNLADNFIEPECIQSIEENTKEDTDIEKIAWEAVAMSHDYYRLEIYEWKNDYPCQKKRRTNIPIATNLDASERNSAFNNPNTIVDISMTNVNVNKCEAFASMNVVVTSNVPMP